MSSQAPRQIKTIIAENLAASRKAKGLTQRQLAVLIDTDPFQVSRWERAANRPNDATLVRLAEALEVDFVTFFIDQERAA
jgi:transcriptional regulator with XRE-family HTH domain